MSFVVEMVGQATTLPALQPMYAVPERRVQPRQKMKSVAAADDDGGSGAHGRNGIRGEVQRKQVAAHIAEGRTGALRVVVICALCTRHGRVRHEEHAAARRSQKCLDFIAGPFQVRPVRRA